MKYAVICFSSRVVAGMVDCRISHNTSETLNENIVQYIDPENGIFEYSGDSGAELQLHAELTESHRSTNFETKPFFVKMESNA